MLRAMPSLSPSGIPAAAQGLTAVPRRRRSYTGAALERRRAWGHKWGQLVRDAARTAMQGRT